MRKSTQQKIKTAQRKVNAYKKACVKEDKLDAQYAAAFEAMEKAKAKLEELQYKRRCAQAEANKLMEQAEDAVNEARVDSFKEYATCESEKCWKVWDEALEEMGVDLTY